MPAPEVVKLLEPRPEAAKQKSLSIVCVHEDYDSSLQPGDLRALKQFPEIIGLSLSTLGFAYDFQPLIGLDQIRYLNIDDVPGSESDLAGTLRSLKNLEWVSIIGRPGGNSYLTVNYDIVAALAECKKLHTVTLHYVNCPHGGLTQLSKLPKLRELKLSSDQIDDLGLKSLSESESLESLEIYGKSNRWSDGGTRFLYRMKRLRSLCIHAPQLTSECLLGLEKSARLEMLLVPRQITDEGLVSIGKAVTLRELDFSNCRKISDAGIDHLLSLQELRVFKADNTRLTREAVLKLAKLPKLQRISLVQTSIRKGGVLESLKTFPELRNASIPGMLTSDTEKLLGNVKDRNTDRNSSK